MTIFLFLQNTWLFWTYSCSSIFFSFSSCPLWHLEWVITPPHTHTPPLGSCIGIFGHQSVAIFGKVIEPLGDWTLLKQVLHWGWGQVLRLCNHSPFHSTFWVDKMWPSVSFSASLLCLPYHDRLCHWVTVVQNKLFPPSVLGYIYSITTAGKVINTSLFLQLNFFLFLVLF